MTSDPDLAERIPGILLRIIRTGSVHFHKDKSRQRCAYAEIQNNATYEFRERSAGVKRVLNYCANVRDIEMNKAKTKSSKSDTIPRCAAKRTTRLVLGVFCIKRSAQIELSFSIQCSLPRSRCAAIAI